MCTNGGKEVLPFLADLAPVLSTREPVLIRDIGISGIGVILTGESTYGPGMFRCGCGLVIAR
jgi:hypothetical protein